MTFLRAVDRLNKALVVVAGIALGLMALSIFYQVLVRFVLTAFNITLSAPWTEELARYLMIWVVFIGGGVAARKGELIAVEALVQALPSLSGKIIKTLGFSVSIIFYIVIFIIGLRWAQFGFSESSPVIGISMFYVYVSIAVGGALMVINTVAFIVELFLNKDAGKSVESNGSNTESQKGAI